MNLERRAPSDFGRNSEEVSLAEAYAFARRALALGWRYRVDWEDCLQDAVCELLRDGRQAAGVGLLILRARSRAVDRLRSHWTVLTAFDPEAIAGVVRGREFGEGDVERLLDLLPSEWRRTLLVWIEADFDGDLAATELSITASCLRKRLQRIRQCLREHGLEPAPPPDVVAEDAAAEP